MSSAIYLLAFFSNVMKYIITQQIIFLNRKAEETMIFFVCFAYLCLFVIQQKFLINIRLFSLLG